MRTLRRKSTSQKIKGEKRFTEANPKTRKESKKMDTFTFARF